MENNTPQSKIYTSPSHTMMKSGIHIAPQPNILPNFFFTS
jgi:hypothetical protein